MPHPLTGRMTDREREQHPDRCVGKDKGRPNRSDTPMRKWKAGDRCLNFAYGHPTGRCWVHRMRSRPAEICSLRELVHP